MEKVEVNELSRRGQCSMRLRLMEQLLGCRTVNSGLGDWRSPLYHFNKLRELSLHLRSRSPKDGSQGREDHRYQAWFIQKPV